MSEEDARRFAATAMSKCHVPFAFAREREDGTWEVVMVA